MNHEIVTQKIILVVGFVIGYYLVIVPSVNYYGIVSTIILVFTFAGGIVANRRSHSAESHSYTPTVSVIIPVKDEERIIHKTIRKYSKVKYPANKWEIIVIDDGSRDNTWSEIQKAIRDFSHAVKIDAFSFKINQGKRTALAIGVKNSFGDIIVTTDSDTFVDSKALRRLVKPFADVSVGGVTGHTYVKNKSTNILTKMQAGLYFYAYRVVRSFQSMFGSVLCLPGTLSAFRKEYVLDVLDEWERAKPFLGEDRHLTYLLLKAGYKTVYVKNAICRTVVPETLRAYLSQQVRWAKGYLIETFRGCRYMFRRHPIIAFTY